jgi:hypothetical protein
MANPNIATSTSIFGGTVAQSPTTTSASFLSCPVNYVYKINTITACNRSVSSVDVSITFYKNSVGTTYYLAYTITVPAKTTLVVVSKDTQIYLNESDNLSAFASASGSIDIVCSYESIN